MWEGVGSVGRLGLKLKNNPTGSLYSVFVPEGEVGRRT